MPLTLGNMMMQPQPQPNVPMSIGSVDGGNIPKQPPLQTAMFLGEKALKKRDYLGDKPYVQNPDFLSQTSVLSKAKEMVQKGDKVDKVWKETGWMIGPDDKWRFEISDADAKLNSSVKKQALDDALDHPMLYKAYPWLKKVSVTVNPNAKEANGLHEPMSIKVNGRNPEEAKGILLHEVQHAIQKYEDWAPGADAEITSMKAKFPKEFEEAKVDSMKDLGQFDKKKYDIDKMAEQAAAWTIYNFHAGEIESEETRSRMKMDDEQRRMNVPYGPQSPAPPQEKWLIDTQA